MICAQRIWTSILTEDQKTHTSISSEEDFRLLSLISITLHLWKLEFMQSSWLHLKLFTILSPSFYREEKYPCHPWIWLSIHGWHGYEKEEQWAVLPDKIKLDFQMTLLAKEANKSKDLKLFQSAFWSEKRCVKVQDQNQRDIQVSLTSSYSGVNNSSVAGEKANKECPHDTRARDSCMKNSCSVSGMCDWINSRKICGI